MNVSGNLEMNILPFKGVIIMKSRILSIAALAAVLSFGSLAFSSSVIAGEDKKEEKKDDKKEDKKDEKKEEKK